MDMEKNIIAYIEGQPETKRSEIFELHQMIQQIKPTAQLWFLDGKNEAGKVVSNPNIGYGFCTLNYANGTTRDFYQVGLSANKSGISVYIIGLDDKKYLSETYGKTLGKASVTGYCISFKTIKDINMEVLRSAIQTHLVYTIEKSDLKK